MQPFKELGVRYRTAWHMPHRIREACERGDFTLTGEVGGKRLADEDLIADNGQSAQVAPA